MRADQDQEVAQEKVVIEKIEKVVIENHLQIDMKVGMMMTDKEDHIEVVEEAEVEEASRTTLEEMISKKIMIMKETQFMKDH